MTWNNRIIRKKWKLPDARKNKMEGYDYFIHEVFYDEEGKIINWTKDPMIFVGEGVKELGENIKFRTEAFKAPVLEEKGKTLVEVKNNK